MAPDARAIRARRFPLHVAVERSDVTRILSLLETSRGELERKLETSGQTPLHIAAGKGNLDVLNILIQAGAKIDEIDCVCQTPLHYSVLSRDQMIVQTLIQSGASVNERRMKDGWTPIFIAAVFGEADVVRLLVESGSDVLLADDLGLTPEDWASKYRFKSIQQVLRKAPRVISESSGKKYKETRGERIENPVEFDENINNLLLRIEQKRKERIMKHEAKLKEAQEETEVVLDNAENSILLRQKRLNISEPVSDLEPKPKSDPEGTKAPIDIFTQSILEKQVKTEPGPIREKELELNEKPNVSKVEKIQESDMVTCLVEKSNKADHANTSEYNGGPTNHIVQESLEPSEKIHSDIPIKRPKREHSKTRSRSKELNLNHNSLQYKAENVVSDNVCHSNTQTQEVIVLRRERSMARGKDRDNSVQRNIPETPRDVKTQNPSNVSELISANKRQTKKSDINGQSSTSNPKLGNDHETTDVFDTSATSISSLSLREPTESEERDECKQEINVTNTTEKSASPVKSNQEFLRTIVELSKKTVIDKLGRNDNLSTSVKAESNQCCQNGFDLGKNISKHQSKSISNSETEDQNLSGKNLDENNNSSSQQRPKATSKSSIHQTIDSSMNYDMNENLENAMNNTKIEEVKVTNRCQMSEKCISSRNETHTNSDDHVTKSEENSTLCKNDNLSPIVVLHDSAKAIDTPNENTTNIKELAESNGSITDTNICCQSNELFSKQLDVSIDPVNQLPQSAKSSCDNNLNNPTSLNADSSKDNYKPQEDVTSIKKELQPSESIMTHIRMTTSSTDSIVAESPSQPSVVSECFNAPISKEIATNAVNTISEETLKSSEVHKSSDKTVIDNLRNMTTNSAVMENQTLFKGSDMVASTTSSPLSSKDVTNSTLNDTEIENHNIIPDVAQAYSDMVASTTSLPASSKDVTNSTLNVTEIEDNSIIPGVAEAFSKVDEVSIKKELDISDGITTTASSVEKQTPTHGLVTVDNSTQSSTVADVSISNCIEIQTKSIQTNSDNTSASIAVDNSSCGKETEPSATSAMENPTTLIAPNMVANPTSSSTLTNDIGTLEANISSDQSTSNSSASPVVPSPTPITQADGVVLMDGLRLSKSEVENLPDSVEDPEFENRIKVFNNYRQFGSMYAAKGNNKKAEWAYGNGIKQTEQTAGTSLQQILIIKQTGLEFRLNRARCLHSLGRREECKEEISLILSLHPENTDALSLQNSLEL